MNSLRCRFVVGIAVACCGLAFGAGPTYVRNGSISLKSLLKKQLECKKHGLDVPTAESAIQLIKVRYPSVDTHGKAVILSGLLILPKSAPKGLVLYYHGTIRDRENAPSRYTGANEYPEPEYVMMAFASGGYAVAMPDYLGLGDCPGVHPYPGGEANSRSGSDMIEPSRTFAKRTGVSLGPHLFVTGYSEGGAIAMCTVRRFETDHSYTPYMAAPMSGPYDLSGSTATSLLAGHLSAEELGTRLFLLAYVGYSALSNFKGIDLKDYFAPSFASYIPYVFGLKIDTRAMAKKFVIKAVQMGAVQSIDRVLTHGFHDAIKWRDSTNPLIAHMMKSDCFDWTPRTKMLLPYLKGDGVVVDTNTTEAIASMRFNGVSPAVVRPYVIDGAKLSHTTAAPLALSAVRRFFDGGFAGVWPHSAP